MYLLLKRRRILGLPEEDPEPDPDPDPEPEPDPDPEEEDPEEEDPPVLVLGGAEVLELFPLLLVLVLGGAEVLELFPLLVELGGEEVVGGAGRGATRAHLNELDSLLMTSSVQL